MQSEWAQNALDIRVAQAQKTSAQRLQKTRMSIGGFRQSYPQAQIL